MTEIGMDMYCIGTSVKAPPLSGMCHMSCMPFSILSKGSLTCVELQNIVVPPCSGSFFGAILNVLL